MMGLSTPTELDFYHGGLRAKDADGKTIFDTPTPRRIATF